MVASVSGGSGRVLGRYLLFDAIARGGMATVHLGRLSGPVGFARTVAIKRLHPHLATDPEFVAMFLDEARLAARIRHPNIVPTLDVVAADGEVFIVMEYIQGESLARLSRAARARNERIPIRYALASLAGALHGLHAAHEVTDEKGEPLGIVHRDVSPQNILVGTDGVSRVLDFGIAKAAGRMHETGDSGSLKGKIAYMAAEQINGSDVTRRTDIYAASVVLWELLAGERLFDGETDAQRVAKIISVTEGNAIPLPSRYNPEVSSALDEIVMRGLSWPPESRWPTAKEMALAIEQVGGLVPASELGDWVSMLARPALAERANRLSAIEALTKREPTMPLGLGLAAPAEAVQASLEAVPPNAPLSSLGSTSVGMMLMPTVVRPLRASTPDTPRSSIRRRVGSAVALVLAVLVAVIGWRLTTAAEVTTVEPTDNTAAGAGPLSPPSFPTPTVTMRAISSAEVSNTAPPSSIVPPPTVPTKGSSPRVGTRAGAAAKPRDACDAPYTIDAENHKIYKRHCINK